MATDANLIGKAEQACESAALLLQHGDIDGACNPAYYAMFDAARAALLSAGIAQADVRTHSGLIAAFGLYLVKTGRVDRPLGRTFNRMQEIRLVADYTGNVVDDDLAAWAVAQARAFVAVAQARAFVAAMRVLLTNAS
ncbi:MAG TPA: HEPN domain-containing protein [Rhodanobacteraceae bacterium]